MVNVLILRVKCFFERVKKVIVTYSNKFFNDSYKSIEFNNS